MYAIVEIAGQQFKVAKDQKVFVHRLAEEEGAQISFDKVLLIEDAGNITVGAPVIEGASVGAKVIRHLKDKKVIVFKKKRRKGYKVKNGHRQYLTEIVVENLGITKNKKKATSKEKAQPVKESEAKSTKKVAETKAVKKETKKAVSKEPKAVAKKETVAKTTVKTTEPKEKKAAKVKKEAVKNEKAAAGTKKDDLKKIEGIGPKIAELLAKEGIETYAVLGKTTIKRLKEILTEAGSPYASKKPNSWPKQAKLASADDWEALKSLQDELKGGV